MSHDTSMQWEDQGVPEAAFLTRKSLTVKMPALQQKKLWTPVQIFLHYLSRHQLLKAFTLGPWEQMQQETCWDSTLPPMGMLVPMGSHLCTIQMLMNTRVWAALVWRRKPCSYVRVLMGPTNSETLCMGVPWSSTLLSLLSFIFVRNSRGVQCEGCRYTAFPNGGPSVCCAPAIHSWLIRAL